LPSVAAATNGACGARAGRSLPQKQHKDDAGRGQNETDASDDQPSPASALVADVNRHLRRVRAGDEIRGSQQIEKLLAREDTVLFPAFRKIVSEHEYDSLGEDFEKREHELFGEEGFHGMVDEVAGIEKKLAIYDLAQFTPRT
jgi:hypothetical protein